MSCCSTKSPNKKFQVVILGGSYSGIFSFYFLEKNKNIELTIIDRRNFFEHTPAVIQALPQPQVHDQTTYALDKVFTNAKFIQAEIISIDENSVQIKRLPQQQEDSIQFDYLILATGSQTRNFTKSNQEETTLELRKQNLDAIREKITQKQNIFVIGSGVVGVETATEIATYFEGKNVTLITRDSKLLSGLTEKAQTMALDYLTKLKIKIEFNKSSTDFEFSPDDLVIECVGNQYNTKFMDEKFSQCLAEDGQIYVNEYMQITSDKQQNTIKNIFSIGDAINLKQISYFHHPYQKVILLANASAKIASHNIQILIQQSLKTKPNFEGIEKKFKKFKAKGVIPMFMITMGKNMTMAVYRKMCKISKSNFKMKKEIAQNMMKTLKGSKYQKWKSNMQLSMFEAMDSMFSKC